MKPATITSSVVHALALIGLPANAEIDETSINSPNNNKSKSEIVQNYNSGFNSFTTAETSFPQNILTAIIKLHMHTMRLTIL